MLDNDLADKPVKATISSKEAHTITFKIMHEDDIFDNLLVEQLLKYPTL
jgi:DNA-directed RNA polymerase subunit L